MEPQRVAVVGAGIAGLTCARELARAGLEVVVLERESTPGGRMNTRVKGGFAFDFGADFLADCYRSLQGLARDVGVRLESAGLVHHLVFRAGRMHPMNLSGPGDVIRFTGLSRWTRWLLVKFAIRTCLQRYDFDFFDLSSLPADLHAESAYAFACRKVNREFADYIVDPFTTTMMFHRSTEVTAGAFLALFSMMASGRFSFGVQRAVGGMRALPAALARQLDLRCGVPVRSVTRADGSWLVTAPGWEDRFDAVVVACTAPAALRLLPDLAPVQRQLLEGAGYSSTIDVSFRIPRHALDGLHCVYVPFVESELVSEFTNEAFKREETVHGDQTLVNVGLHEGRARELLGEPDAVIFERVKQEMLRFHPGLASAAGSVIPHDLQRWWHALPRYGAAHVDRVRRFWSAGQGERGLWLCGDYLNHPWLEGAVRCGQRVARRLLAEVPAATASSTVLSPS